MSDDPRTDFFASGADSAPVSDQDARTAFFASGGQSQDTSSVEYRPTSGSAPMFNPKGKQPELIPMLWEGSKELAQGIVHGAGTLADVVTGTSPGEGSHANRWASVIDTDPSMGGQINPNPPISPEQISRTYDKTFGTGPAAQTIKERAPQAFEAITTAVPAIKFGGGLVGKVTSTAPVVDTQAAMDAAAANSPQSMGAAAAAQRVNSLSPAMQQGFREAVQKTGGAVNPDTAINHAEADLHGVQLMEGQASRDADTFSREQNSTHKDIVKRINDQNGQMTEALDNIRREASPGAVQNDPIQNGQIAVDALKAYDEPIQADIRAKYKALTDANGGAVPIDPGTFLGKVDAALKKNYLTNSVPPSAAELLSSVRNGEPLDFEGFEAARTRLAEAQREGGSAGQAARIIRSELEQLPLSPAGASLKGLADTARSAAKARFDALDADPAYQAAVDDASNGVRRGEPSALADRFLDKYALGNAPRANLDRMMGKLDPEAQQAVAAHALSAIRKGAIPASGTITPTGFNNALAKYSPKLGSLVSPETQESLESLARVVHNAKTPPPGHFVNYSKSGVIVNAAQGLGEAALNAKTLGMGMPIIKNLSENSFAKRVLKPGAGLDKLSPSQLQ